MITKQDIVLARGDNAVGEAEHTLSIEELSKSILTDAFASLDAIATSLEAMVSSGTKMTPSFAMSTRATIHYVSAGALSEDLVSLESASSGDFTRLTLESLQETLKDIWDKIKAAIKNAIRVLGDFATKLLGGMEQMQVKIEELRTQNKKQQKRITELYNNDVDVGYWPKLRIRSPERIMINGRVDLTTISSGMRLVKSQLLNGTVTYYGLVGKYYEQIESVISNGKPLDKDSFAKFVAGNDVVVTEMGRLNSRVFSKELFPGDKRIKVDVVEKDEFSILGKLDIKLDSKARDLKDVYVNTPTGDWTTDILNSCDEIIKSLLDSRRKDQRSLMDRRTEIVEKLDGIYKNLNMDVGEAEGKRLKLYMRLINKDHLESAVKVDRYLYSYVRALLDVVTGILSLKGSTLRKASSGR